MNAGLHFVVAGDPAQLTGGYRYDARIVQALRARGLPVDVTGLPGRFPHADDAARQALHRALASLPDRSIAVIDGLALGGLPEVAGAHARRLRLVALVHHPLADETGLEDCQRAAFLDSERAALAHMVRVIATSRFTARRLADYGVDAERIAVIDFCSTGPSVSEKPGAASRRCSSSQMRSSDHCATSSSGGHCT